MALIVFRKDTGIYNIAELYEMLINVIAVANDVTDWKATPGLAFDNALDNDPIGVERVVNNTIVYESLAISM